MDWICTQVKSDYIEYEWTIKNFEELSEENGEYIESPVFPVTNNYNEKWTLKLFPRGQSANKSEWISLFLWPALDEMCGIKVKYEMSISRSNQLLQTRTNEHKYENIIGFGYQQFVHRMILLNSDDSDNCDNTITVHCKIDLLGTYVTSSLESSKNQVTFFESKVYQLDKDFSWLYKNHELSDFTVVSGSERFPAHKAILASRSNVFAVMFENKKMEENVKNEIKIENMQSDVVERMLEFIYKNYVTDVDEFAGELLAAAEQYALEGLKHLCEKTLYKTLKIDNAIHILEVADLHHAHQLKEHVIKYIVNHYSQVIKSEGFKSTQVFPELAKKLFTALNSSKDDSKKSVLYENSISPLLMNKDK